MTEQNHEAAPQNGRRDFLKGAALAAGAMAVTGCVAPGAARIGAVPGAIGTARSRTPVGEDGLSLPRRMGFGLAQ